ncbi:MAG: proline--tRNA ligase [Actinomycetota bacterium]
MIARVSSLFLRTLREDPVDAEVPSHRLLVRAGYIRRVAPGIYTWLPLGLRVLRKVERIVREEMNAAGAQELTFPALLPREPYEQTGRWTEYGAGLFRLRDRKEADYLLGPTHEEMFTLVVKDMCSSYKDLPLSLYQIQTKYRDEARPRAGLLRGREFIMKDSYSFDLDDEGLQRSYQAHRAAYVRIFDRLGLDYVVVSAVSGAMGGSASEEFLACADNGEDTYVRSPGGYAANVEAVLTLPPDPREWGSLPPAHVEQTPQADTIDALVTQAAEIDPSRLWSPGNMLKNVVFMLLSPDGAQAPVVIGIPGDRQVDLKRLAAQVEPASIELFTDDDFARHPQLVKGYVGPQGLSRTGIRYLVDPRVVDGTVWVSGADHRDQHVFDLVKGRDFDADGTVEAAEVRAGDLAPDGSGPLEVARGIEIGHIFQLGRKYAEALGLKVLDANGKNVTVTMGCYGIGVSRVVAAIAEGRHDERGLLWPQQVAPYDVHVVATGKDDSVFSAAESVCHELSGAGLDVLYDDRRRVSPGVKFADSELIGVPLVVVVGRGVAGGVVEVRQRAQGTQEEVPLAEVASVVKDLLAVSSGSQSGRSVDSSFTPGLAG